LQFRKNNKAVSEGETFILPSQNGNQLMAYIRRNGKEVVLVLLNLSNDDRVTITVDNSWFNGTFRNIFSGLSFSFSGKETFELQAGEYVVYEKIQ
jgi:glycosidase